MCAVGRLPSSGGVSLVISILSGSVKSLDLRTQPAAHSDRPSTAVTDLYHIHISAPTKQAQ
ncbi:MAG: hypothetical protein K2J61_02585, partial [Clostridia bacterium]|nr:hypothetical protein [Clostridia bacterium]